jgi:plasmid stability protein
MAAKTLTIELSDETYARLRARAQEQGKTAEALSREMIEDALPRDGDSTRVHKENVPGKSIRDILAATGRLRELGPELEARIIPGVTLEEVQDALTRAGGPSLSEIVDANRGPKD